MKNCTIINVEEGTSLYFCKTPMTYQEALDHQTDEFKLVKNLPWDYRLRKPIESFGEPVEVNWHWRDDSERYKKPCHFYWTSSRAEGFTSDKEGLMARIAILTIPDPESKLGAIYVKVPQLPQSS